MYNYKTNIKIICKENVCLLTQSDGRLTIIIITLFAIFSLSLLCMHEYAQIPVFNFNFAIVKMQISKGKRNFEKKKL